LIVGNPFIPSSSIFPAAELAPAINTNIMPEGTNAKVLSADPGAELEIAGVISGEGGIRKTGDGPVRLDRPNSYTGLTSIEAGILVAGDASALGASGLAMMRWFCRVRQIKPNVQRRRGSP
jgi:autotransporter-associated beta strand protein